MSGADITGDGDGRKIGNGVVISFVSVVAAITALVALDKLDATVGLIVFLAMFALVFAGDLYIQGIDMDTRPDAVSPPEPSDD